MTPAERGISPDRADAGLQIPLRADRVEGPWAPILASGADRGRHRTHLERAPAPRGGVPHPRPARRPQRGSGLREGVTVEGSAGQRRAHPALIELRQEEITLGRLLSQLALPDETGEALPSLTEARARRAAETRWRAHRG